MLILSNLACQLYSTYSKFSDFVINLPRVYPREPFEDVRQNDSKKEIVKARVTRGFGGYGTVPQICSKRAMTGLPAVRNNPQRYDATNRC